MRNAVLSLCLLTLSAGASDLLQYAEDDGTVKTVPVVSVRRDSEDEFNARVRIAGRSRTLKIPSRQVVAFWRGNSDDVNQWSKSLARAKRLMAAGQIATQGTVAGAEEMFTKIAISVEEGTKGQEESEAISPWHNMFAVYHLIEARYRLGTEEKKADKLEMALADIAMFEKRTEGKAGKKIKMDVPGDEGLMTKEVYCWGDSRLTPYVMVHKARILAALGKSAEAMTAFDEALTRIKSKDLSPILLTDAVMAKAELEAAGKESEAQEAVFRAAGTLLATIANNQKDAFGKATLRAAGNRALLRGADLLLASAQEGKFSYDAPLQRYASLRATEGATDRALYVGASAGVGICLAEKGEGEKAYKALLEVVVKGGEYPAQMARALYYLAKAAPLYAKEIDASGGKGQFLRDEADMWKRDLMERYPTSEWAKKG